MKTYKKSTDEELISAVLQNDSNAMGELYSRYYEKVFHKCLSIVKNHDEAFDLAQEALMKCFENLKSFRGESSFGTWVYVITHRYCLGVLRKRKKMAVDNIQADDLDENNEILLSEVPEENEQENIMLSLIDHLPEEEKELLFLKYEKGESIEELTTMLSVSSSAVKMRLKRTREKLNYLFMMATSLGLQQALSQLQ
jgi:RNA polymerase sigma-70 factor (ECF subfamily)